MLQSMGLQRSDMPIFRKKSLRKMGRRIGNIPGEVREAACGMRMGACDDGIGSRDFLETGEGDFGGIVSKSL